MSFPYKNPLNAQLLSSPYSVPRTSIQGTNFSILGIGGWVEVGNISDLSLSFSGVGLQQSTGTTIPINFYVGNGTPFNPSYISLNSDNFSSGRRRLGMVAYVNETNLVYQFQIDNYDTLWNAATAATNTVVYNLYDTQVKNNSVAGQNFINAWTGSTVEGISGVTRANARWRLLMTGGTTPTLYTGDDTIQGNRIVTQTGTSLTFSGGTGGTFTILEKFEQGDDCITLGPYSHAEGSQTTAGIYGYHSTSINNGVIYLDISYGDVSNEIYTYAILDDSDFSNNYGIVGFEIDSVIFNGINTIINLIDTTVNTTEANIGTNLNFSLGADRIIGGHQSHSEGRHTQTVGDYSHSEGVQATAVGSYSHSEGTITISLGLSSHSEGVLSSSFGMGSHAEGSDTQSNGIGSHSEGSETEANGTASHSEGYRTKSNSSYSHSEGIGFYSDGSTFVNTYSIGLFEYTDTVYPYSFSSLVLDSNQTTIIVSGDYSFLTQPYTLPNFIIKGGPYNNTINVNLYYFNPPIIQSITYDSFLDETTFTFFPKLESVYYGIQGIGNVADGAGSHAEGYSTTSIGLGSHAEGSGTTSSGVQSHAEGGSTRSTGIASHAEGNNTISYGEFSHAEGYNTISLAHWSHSEGKGTIAEYKYEKVSGWFNQTGVTNSATTLYVIGNGGSDTARSNLAIFETTGVTIYRNLTVSASTDPVKFLGLQSATDSNVLTVDGTGVVHTYPISGITGSSINIYNSDGVLTGDRVMDMSSYTLTLSGKTYISYAPTANTDNVLVVRNKNTSTNAFSTIALGSDYTNGPVDIRLADTNTQGIRIYASDVELTTIPDGAGFQFFNNATIAFPGQVFFDSGAHNNAAIIWRTAPTLGTITERMRVTSDGNVGIGTTSPNGKLQVDLDNTDYTNTGGAGSHILLNNPNPAGQNVLSSLINGVVVAKWRTDYVGNINWVAGTGGSQAFYTNGDFGVGRSQMCIFNNGNIKMETTTIGGSNVDNGYKLDVIGTGGTRFSATTDPVRIVGLSADTSLNLLNVDTNGVVHTNDISTGLTINGPISASTYYGDGSNLNNISRGGGGGLVFFINQSVTQNGYKEFATTATTTGEVIVTATTGSSLTALIGTYETPSGVPGTTLIPSGYWTFYLHSYVGSSNANFDLFCEVYKITTGGTETLLLSTDPVLVNSVTTIMSITDGFLTATTLNVSDRIIVRVKATNITNQTQTIYFLTEGSQHYSYGLSTFPVNQLTFSNGLTLSANNVVLGGTLTATTTSLTDGIIRTGNTNASLFEIKNTTPSSYIAFNPMIKTSYHYRGDSGTTSAITSEFQTFRSERNAELLTGRTYDIAPAGVSGLTVYAWDSVHAGLYGSVGYGATTTTGNITYNSGNDLAHSNYSIFGKFDTWPDVTVNTSNVFKTFNGWYALYGGYLDAGAKSGSTMDRFMFYTAGGFRYYNSNLYLNISDAMGLYVAPMKSAFTGITRGWGVYQEGSQDNNYFGGDIGIGTTAITNSLHVSASTDPVRIVGLSASTDTSLVTIDGNGVLHTFLTTNLVTLYRSNGALGGNRLVNLVSYALSFSSSTQPNTLMLSGGNVGIGTTVSSYKLDVGGTVRTTNDTRLANTSGNVLIGPTPTSGSYSGGTIPSTLTINSGGGGGISFLRPTDFAQMVAMTVPDGSTLKIGGGNQNNIDIYGHTTFIARFSNSGSGMLGVGTSSPSNTLHVSASTDPVKFVGLSASTDTDLLTIDSTGVLHKIATSGLSTSAATLYNSNGTLSGNRVVSISASSLNFSSSTQPNLLVLDGGNQVGIGTITPTNKLTVSATTDPVKFVGLQSASDSTVLTVDGTGVVHTFPIASLASGTIYKSSSNTFQTNSGTSTFYSSAISSSNFSNGDSLKINVAVTMSTTSVNSVETTYWINSAATMVGATQISLYTGALGFRYYPSNRFYWTLGGLFYGRGFTTTTQNSDSNSNTPIGTVTIPSTFYIIVQVSTTGTDRACLASFQVTKS